MKVYMTARFQILRKQQDGTYLPISRDQLRYLSVGGFYFIVDGNEIPFDWDAAATSEVEDCVFEYESGYGPFFNDHEISDTFEQTLRSLGLCMENLTAKFLASASKIVEFHVYIDDLETDNISFGIVEDNANDNSNYRVKINSIEIADDTEPDNAKPYVVAQSVIDNYNRGGVEHGK